MNKQDMLIAIGVEMGHKALLKVVRKVPEPRGYLKKFIEANKDVDVDSEISARGGCPGNEGKCGECRDDVWYPCT